MKMSNNSSKKQESKEIQTMQVWVPSNSSSELFTPAVVTESSLTTYKSEDGSIYNISDCAAMNPSLFDSADDLAQLSHLNEPSVLNTLKNRYDSGLMYTNSGIFLISVNPYTTVPDDISGNSPHVFNIANKAYTDMMSSGISQSILITGESGAGKTENTKKVIEYLCKNNESPINNLLLLANPLIEAFGNAKTLKNNNSSRFGKYIQVFFSNGKLVSGRILKYLLEKSRVCNQEEGEQNYHIFYILLKNSTPALKKELFLEENFYKNVHISPDSFIFTSAQELLRLFDSFGIDGMEYLRIAAGVMNMSNFDVSDPNTKVYLQNACKLLGIKFVDFWRLLTAPVIKAGGEIVSVTRTPEQVNKIIEGVMKSLYDRMFDRLIDELNMKLAFGKITETNIFIGILDIAGFEIFKINSFEQLLINFTNEKLQQYFNHHMFIKEQGIYKKENIEWEFIDFGLDLEPCIKTITNNYNRSDNNHSNHNSDNNNSNHNFKNIYIGILEYLDEECLMPCANDSTFIHKVKTIKSEVLKVKENDLSFILKHYAGNVEYNVSSWIEKNKDYLHQEMSEILFKNNSGNSIFTKKGYFRTITQGHLTNLENLMKMLESTDGHFIRCIIPNIKKSSRIFDQKLILGQLRCNGVLEGIRISRLGYPSRILYADFIKRYSILINEDKISIINQTENCITNQIEHICSGLFIKDTDYKLGKTMIFLKTGVIAELEAKREEQLIIIGNFIKMMLESKKEKNDKNLISLKSDINFCLSLLKNNWWKLYQKVKPLLNEAKEEEIKKNVREEYLLVRNERDEIKDKFERLSKEKNLLENEIVKVCSIRDQLNNSISQMEKKMEKKSSDFEIQNLEYEKKVESLNFQIDSYKSENWKLSEELESVKILLKNANSKIEELKIQFDSKIDEFKSEIENLKSNNLELLRNENEYKSQIEVLKSNKLELSSEYKNLQKNDQKLISEIENLKEAKSKGVEEVNKLTALLFSKNSEKLILENKIGYLNDRLNSKQEETATAQKYHELEEKYFECISENEQLKNSIENQIQVNSDISNQFKNEIENQKSEYENRFLEQKLKFDSEESNFKKEIQNFNSENLRLKSIIDKNILSQKSLSDEIESLKSKNEKSKIKIYELSKDLKEKEESNKKVVSELESQINVIKEENEIIIQEHQNKIEKLSSSFKETDDELSETKEKLKISLLKIEEFTKMINKLTDEKRDLERTVGMREREIGLKTREVERLNSDLLSLKADKERFKNDLSMFNKQIGTLQSDNHILKSTNETHIAEKDDQISQLNSIIERIETERNEIAAENAKLIEELQSKSSKYNELTNEFEIKSVNYKNKIEKMEHVTSRLQKEVEFKKMRNMVSHEPVKIPEEPDNSQSIISVLKLEIDHLKELNKQAQKENDILAENRMQELLKNDAEMTKHSKQYQIEINKLKAEINRLSNDIVELQQNTNCSSAENNSDILESVYYKNINSLNLQVSELEMKNLELESKNSKLIEDLKAINKLKEEVSELKEDLNSILSEFVSKVKVFFGNFIDECLNSDNSDSDNNNFLLSEEFNNTIKNIHQEYLKKSELLSKAFNKQLEIVSNKAESKQKILQNRIKKLEETNNETMKCIMNVLKKKKGRKVDFMNSKVDFIGSSIMSSKDGIMNSKESIFEKLNK